MANIDTPWIEGEVPALQALADTFDPAKMNIAVLLAPRERSYGFERPEGFDRDAEGRLTHSNSTDPLPAYVNIGFQALDPAVVADRPDGPFSIVPIWKDLAARGRLYGAVMDGFAMHVSDPAARHIVEKRMLEGAAG